MTLPVRVCEQPREMSSLASSLSKRQTHLGNIGASSTRCNVCQLLKLLIGRIVQENLGTSNRFSAHVHKKINAIHEHIAWKKPRKQKKEDAKKFCDDNLGKIHTADTSNVFSYPELDIPEIMYCCICQKPKEKHFLPRNDIYFQERLSGNNL